MKKYLLVLILVLFPPANALSMDITLTWDKNPDADYYVVYWGAEAGNYTGQSAQIPGTETEYTNNEIDEANVFFSVKAFNDCGNSSEFSEEVMYCKPVSTTGNVSFKVENSTINIIIGK